ncbi:MAG: ion transporter [Planctomycetaceae bacterium]|nr:ion transporter [Planctomycetales bacterium]MCB9873758.1 ion transporter [Planctomycetaceae bacterium]MCB9939751.1 ion transporter [Planctomycetaceae bacterium]HRX79298.1 ion transporter [Pirellulaceae bacterium]
MEHQPRAAWRDKLHEVIFEADTRAGQWFDIGLLVAILISVTVVCLETVEDLQSVYGVWFYYAEWTLTVLFTIEYALRLICVRRPLGYATSFYGIVDLLSFLPTYVSSIGFGRFGSFAVVRSFRLLRVFRVLKLINLTSESEDLAGAVWRARGKIIVFLAVVFITVTIAGAAMYEVERIHDPIETQFTSIPQSIYWAIVTMTTVGYGDIVPHTTLGKLLSALLILVGYSLIIVPTGFVSAEAVESRKKRKALTQTCPYCMAEGHLSDAVYCRLCGKPL